MLDEVKVRERKSAKHGKTYEYRFEIAQVGGERKWCSKGGFLSEKEAKKVGLAEYERGTIVERTQTGKAVARQDPNFKDGRPKKFTPEQIALALSLLEQGKTYRRITTMTGISKSTLISARKQGA